jgi:4-amino-4-deoxy-L-arabinose transferase-like glycosyltransferase
MPITPPEHLVRYRLGAVFLLALIIKVAFLIAASDNPFVVGLTNDESYHVAEAGSILREGVVRDDAFYFAPLYPYLLAGLFRLVGESVPFVLVLQVVLGALNVVLILLLAERVLASRRAAWIAAALTLLFGPLYMYEWLVLKSTLAVAMTSLALVLLFRALDRGADGVWFASGAVFGLLALLRGNVLVLLPFVFLGLIIELRRGRLAPASLAVWLVGVACGILPATVHNAVAASDFVPTTYQGGTNFYIGNHRGASGTYEALRPGRGHPAQEKYDAVTLAEASSGRPLWPSEVSSFWFHRALGEIAENPAEWAQLTIKKARLFHANAEIMDVVDYRLFRELEPHLWLVPLSFGLIVGLAVPGLYLARRLPDARLLALVLVGSAASVILFFVFGRYRLPVVGVYTLFAAAAVDGMIDGVRAREWRPLLATIIVSAVVFGLTAIPIVEDEPAMAYNTLGGMYARAADLDQARRWLERAVQELPDQPELRHNLANVLMARGEHCAAAGEYSRAADLRRGSPMTADPIVRLQLFEITRARTEALARCGDDQQQLEHAREDLADLARSLLEDARAGAFEPTPELRASLEAAAGANANRHTPPTGESESRP